MELLGYFTSKGEALSAKLLMGTPLTITRVTAGDGETSVDAVALAHDCQTLPVSTMLRDGTTVTLPVTLVSAAAANNYTLTELGVYADDPEEGEILYRIYRPGQPMNITANGQLTIRFYLKETVSEAAEVTVLGTSAGLLTVADRGTPAGVAALDASGTVPPAQLPYSWGLDDLEDGVSLLAPGRLYFVCADGTLPDPDSGSNNGLIFFTIDGKSYSADNGMTWGEWITSAYYDPTLQLEVHSGSNYMIYPSDESHDGWLRDSVGCNVSAKDLLAHKGEYVMYGVDSGDDPGGGVAPPAPGEDPV